MSPDGQVVAEPVDVDGPAAVLLLPDRQKVAVACLVSVSGTGA